MKKCLEHPDYRAIHAPSGTCTRCWKIYRDRFNAPRWILKRYGVTQRQWKQMKRTEAHDLVLAFETFRIGSAYSPAYPHLMARLDIAVKDLQKALSIKIWGN